MSNIFNFISFFLFLATGEHLSIIPLWGNGIGNGIVGTGKEGF